MDLLICKVDRSKIEIVRNANLITTVYLQALSFITTVLLFLLTSSPT